MALFGSKPEGESQASTEPITARIYPDQNCCATCLWWEGKRSLVKQYEQKDSGVKGKPIFFIRIFKDMDGECLNFKSKQCSQRFMPIVVCPDFETWFQGGIPKE
jgi:hypothetical protein